MYELLAIVLLSLLSMALSRWYYRRYDGAVAGASLIDGARLSPSTRQQAAFFARTTAIDVLVATVALALLSRAIADWFVLRSLREQLAAAFASLDQGGVSLSSVAIVVDKIRNRVAFPDLYQDQPPSVFLENAVNWYLYAQNLVDVVVWTVIIVGSITVLAWRLHRCQFNSSAAQMNFEVQCRHLLLVVSSVAVLCSVGIVVSLLIESVLFFTEVSLIDFLFGLHWNPQVAIRADQTAAQGAFGFVPLLSGTLLISAVAIALAFPSGLMIAVYTSEYASDRQRMLIKPTMEILTGIPTVVYGAFAAIYAGPWLRDFFTSLGFDATVESALAVGVIMGIMIVPLVSSLVDDALRQVPRSIREAMFAIGATRFELVKMVLLPASLSGIVGALLLAISRAFGETMIVVMAAGLAAKLSINPLESVTTVTVQIATILVGDQVFDSVKTLSAFALGLTLFIITLSLNVLASWVISRFKVVYQ